MSPWPECKNIDTGKSFYKEISNSSNKVSVVTNDNTEGIYFYTGMYNIKHKTAHLF